MNFLSKTKFPSIKKKILNKILYQQKITLIKKNSNEIIYQKKSSY
jgi:hypothetical protein